jgi:hypothetical protein
MLYKIPITVTSESNSNEHWLKKAKRHTKQKMVVKSYLRNTPFPNGPPWHVILTRFAPRRMDGDNLSMAFKWIRDAVSEVLCHDDRPGRSDDDDRITWEYRQEKSGIAKEYYIMIQIDSVV